MPSRVGIMLAMLLAVFNWIGAVAVLSQAQKPAFTCDEEGLLPIEAGCTEHAKRPAPTTRPPLPTCQLPFPRRFGEWTDLDGRFHVGTAPIELSCGNEEIRDWNFAALRAWTTERWHQRQLLNKTTGDVDTEAFARWHSLISQVQARGRLDQGGERIKAEIESMCRCRL